jgi:8-oxo-dGTP diphosphatase
MQYETPYAAPTLTVDLVGFQILHGELCALIIQRPNEPFSGTWALPGGYNPEGETTEVALQRIIRHKIGIDTEKDFSYIEQLYTFDTVARDPRGHAVSVTYMACGRAIELPPVGYETVFTPVSALPELAYDHADIIDYARKRLAAKLLYTNIAFAFLPLKFTLTELQSVYEALLGRKLDKRNFRKKILSQAIVSPSGELRTDAAHRPAQLYQFDHQELREVTEPF